jgi:regulatory protein
VKRPRSLKARALQWLAQREHSRPELRRKLLAHARLGEEAKASTATPIGQALGSRAVGDPRFERAGKRAASHGVESVERHDGDPNLEESVDALLDWLEARQFLSAERFAESRIHARSARFGNLRIRQELSRHDIRPGPEAVQALADSELDRARAVHRRRFAEGPASAAERARQARFLVGRGFSSDVIRRVLRSPASADDADEG